MTQTTPTPRRAELNAFFGAGDGLAFYQERRDYRQGEQFLFERFFHPGGRLLDIGCGTGRTSFLLDDRQARVDAFDIVPAMVREAVRRREAESRRIGFFVADAASIPVAPGRYDNALFSYNGFEGLPSDALRMSCLAAVYRALRPGGRFIFSTKSYFNLDYFRHYHFKRGLRRLGLPLFPGVAALGKSQVYVKVNTQRLAYHTSNPFRVRRMLREIGFLLIYFNSEVRLKAGKTRPSFTANFHRWDHFYVCEKS